MSCVQSLVCGDCPVKVTFSSIDDLKKHYIVRHNQIRKFTCAECKSELMNKTSLVRHIENQHPYLISGSSSQHSNEGSSAHVFTGEESRAFGGHGNPTGESGAFGGHDDPTGDQALQGTFGYNMDFQQNASFDESENSLSDDIVCLDKLAIRMIMELRSTASLTGRAIERFQQGSLTLLRGYRQNLIQDLTVHLKNVCLSETDKEDILKIIKDPGDIFRNLKTIEDQLDAFAEEFGMVKPVEKFLWTRLDKRLDPLTNSYMPTQVKVSFQYVSIIEILKALLSNKQHRKNIFTDWSSKDGILRSYMDGSDCKNNPFVRKHKNVIFILLFFDELEVATALGSKTIIHKLGAFFIQLLNASAAASSKLSSIHLLILAYAEDLKKPGAWDKILFPLIADMKKLSSDEGVEFEIDGQTIVIRALLSGVTADTLAAHDLLGFLGPGARHFCRCCMISRQELRLDSNHVAEPRTKHTHDQQVQEVLRVKKKSTLFGVKRDCPLNVLPYFHSAESSVFDSFHDILEGVASLDVKLVLRHFICIRKLLTIEDFNSRVESYCYGLPDAKNRPSPNFVTEMLTTRKKLKQTGSQMWCLVRALPFLLLDSLENTSPEDEECMKLIFHLQDAMRVIFAFEISDQDVDALDVSVYKHNELFKKLFIDTPVQLQPEDGDEEPQDYDQFYESENEDEVDDPGEAESDDENVRAAARQRRKMIIYMINKMHHLKHSCEQIRKYGPTVRMWCAKFEGRLKIFRQHSAVCCNFKNVPKTMAQMFQLSNVSSLWDEEEQSIECRAGENVQVKNMYLERQLFLNLGFSDSEMFVLSPAAIVNGEEYRPGLFVRLVSNRRHLPVFAMIVKVYVDLASKSVHLYVNRWNVDCFSLKYNCHKVSPIVDGDFSLVNVFALANFRAIAPWFVSEDSSIYLSLRTGLF